LDEAIRETGRQLYSLTLDHKPAQVDVVYSDITACGGVVSITNTPGPLWQTLEGGAFVWIEDVMTVLQALFLDVTAKMFGPYLEVRGAGVKI
jgi:hypothetical protein